jgi:hypothetical protein
MTERDDLNRYNNPARFAEVAQRHTNAFAWQRQGRIPLGVHVVNPDHARGLNYSDWLNPKPFLHYQTRVLEDTLAVGSELMPAVAINHLGHGVLASAFGARLYMPEDAGATLQDVGPTPLPVFSCIDEVRDLQLPSLDSGLLPQVREFAAFYRRNLPDWVHVVAPMPSGPLSTAMELRGSEMLLDMADKPELCKKLIVMCARMQAEIEVSVCKLVGTPLDRHVTNFGIMGVGLRLGDDSMVNLSPEMIREFCRPAFAEANRVCGGNGHIHFCSLPHSRHEHVYGALAGMPEVAVVSSQFGFEYYEHHIDELRGRIAVESFYGDAYRYVYEKHGSFAAWAEDFVKRFKNESGLVLYCQVGSLEEGREVWAAWERAHNV